MNYADPRCAVSAVVSTEVVEALAAAGFQYPKVETVKVASLAFNLSTVGVQSAQPAPSTAYRLTSDDGRWTVSLSGDTVSLETPSYGRWHGDFKERFFAILKAIADHIQPAVIVRLGLRYVDILLDSTVTHARDWNGKIRPAFLGAITDENFAPAVLLTQQQMTLSVGDGLKAILRHGSFRDQDAKPSVRYLIDTDVFRDAFVRFDLTEVQAILEPMHNISKQLFEYVITPEYYQELAKAK